MIVDGDFMVRLTLLAMTLSFVCGCFGGNQSKISNEIDENFGVNPLIEQLNEL